MTGNVPFVIIGEDYGMSRNMGYVIILLTVILSAGLMGCTKTNEPVADGNTTITSDFVMMKASYSPGGEMTEEEWERDRQNYQIISSGDVIDKNDKKITLSTEDYEKVLGYYSKFCKGKVKSKKIDAQDYSSYSISVYDGDKEYKYFSDGSEQSEAVEDIFDIISPYFKESKE